jgi:hypothetical protein
VDLLLGDVHIDDARLVHEPLGLERGHDLGGHGCRDLGLGEGSLGEVAVVGAGDVEEGEALARHLPVIVGALHKGGEVHHTGGDVLDS